MTCDARGNRGRDDDDRRRRSTFLVLREKLKIAHETDRRRVDGPAMKTQGLDLDFDDLDEDLKLEECPESWRS